MKTHLEDYLSDAGYNGHNKEQKMSTCADTCDVETFEEAAQNFARCLEKLLLDFWSGERQSAESDVEELLIDGCSEQTEEECMMEQM